MLVALSGTRADATAARTRLAREARMMAFIFWFGLRVDEGGNGRKSRGPAES
jgi:hypothetical protein